jgi:hypothetical protein
MDPAEDGRVQMGFWQLRTSYGHFLLPYTVEVSLPSCVRLYIRLFFKVKTSEVFNERLYGLSQTVKARNLK